MEGSRVASVLVVDLDATLGRLARLRGDEAEAHRLLEVALALEERSGAVLFAERTRRDLAG